MKNIRIPFRFSCFREEARHASEMAKRKAQQAVDDAQKSLEVERLQLAQQARADQERERQSFDEECQRARANLDRELRAIKERHDAQIKRERQTWDDEHARIIEATQREVALLKQVGLSLPVVSQSAIVDCSTRDGHTKESRRSRHQEPHRVF